MTNTEIAALVRHDLVTAARKDCETAAVRLAEARADLMASETAVDAAWKAALDPSPGTDPKAAETAHREAEAHLVYARKRVPEMERQLAAAQAAMRKASGKSWRPVFEQGVAQRIAAAQLADEARAMLAEAEAQNTEATKIVNQAHAQGLPRPFDGMHLAVPVRTEAAERALWQGGV